MMKEIEYSTELPSIDDYWNLFETTGWNSEYNFVKTDLEEAINNSWFSVSAYHGHVLAGFGRIIADGVNHALIVDVIVHPDYQGRGIGSEVMRQLVEKCEEHHIRDIQLFAAKGKSGFYERLGFEKRPADAPGMQLKR